MEFNLPVLSSLNTDELLQMNAQLKKDFEMEQIVWNCSEDRISADRLVGYLTEKVRDMIRSADNKLARLLYRVDVSEEMLKSHSKESSEMLSETVLCKKILERTFQKIKLRQAYKKYSSGTHDDNIIDR